jgi:hypothetical protein
MSVKKVLCLLLITMMAILGATGVQPTVSVAAANAQISPESVIKKQIELENAQHWNQIPDLWIDSERDSLRTFISQPENKANNIGLFNIRGAKLIGIKELPNDLAQLFTYLPKYSSVYPNIKAYYVAVDYKVAKDTRFYFNNINYFLALVVQDGGQWKLAQFSTAPVHAILKKGHGFGTSDESKAGDLYKKREKGIYLNRNGKLMEGSAPETLAPESHTRPTTISVRLTKSKNYSNYYCSSECTKNIDFYSYVKNTLPNEWTVTAGMEALHAGALAVKMYGWFATGEILHPNLGANVYDDIRDQAYLVGSESLNANTTTAINDMDHKGLETATNNFLFLAYHNSLTSYDYQGSGRVYQPGTERMASNGKTYDYMLHYYYDKSTTLSGDDMAIFTY